MSTSVLFSLAYVISWIPLITISDSSFVLPWSWDTVPSWADMYMRNRNVKIITDTRAQFIADHYSVVSLEKCYRSGTYPSGQSREAFYEAATTIRQFGSSDKIKILFYWNIAKLWCSCYASIPGVVEFCSNTTTNPESASMPQLDLSKTYVRQWWINTLMICLEGAFDQGIIIDGVFLDGAVLRRDSYISVLLTETRHAFAIFKDEYGIDLFIMGNRLMSTGSYNVEALPYVDGMSVEHFASFEEVEQTETGSFDPDKLLFWFDIIPAIMNGTYGDNKSVFFKAIIGPASMIDGSVKWPSWYGTIPTTNKEWQDVSARLITFPLAVYLCGIAYKNVYFSYGWWYSIDHGFVPCPEDPSSCYSPLDWYPELIADLGEPLTNPIMSEKYKCNRSFQQANVYVDLRDDNSAIIEWIPPTPFPTKTPTSQSVSPTAATMNPTMKPSSSPTLSIKITNRTDNKNPGIKMLFIQIFCILFVLFGCVGYYYYKQVSMNRNTDGNESRDFQRMDD